MVVGPLVKDFVLGANPPPFFATCVARRRPSVPLQQCSDGQLVQAIPADLQGNSKYKSALMVRRQEPERGHCQHYTPPAVNTVATVGRRAIGTSLPHGLARACEG